MKKLIFILLCVHSIFSFSQEGYDVGYIITNTGDTLKGKIKDRKYRASPANCDKISFIGSDGIETNETPDDIKQYVKSGSQFFYSLPIGFEAKLKFAEIIEYGEVILFGFVSNSFVSTTTDLLSKSGESKKDGKSAARMGIEYCLQRKKDVNSLMKVKPKKFVETTTFYFRDNAELVKKIEDKIFKYEDIKLVVKTYNEVAATKK